MDERDAVTVVRRLRSGVNGGKWHRETLPDSGMPATWLWEPDPTERVLLADVDPGDLCRRCFGEVPE